MPEVPAVPLLRTVPGPEPSTVLAGGSDTTGGKAEDYLSFGERRSAGAIPPVREATSCAEPAGLPTFCDDPEGDLVASPVPAPGPHVQKLGADPPSRAPVLDDEFGPITLPESPENEALQRSEAS
jgi:hypothetical protein